MVGVAVAVVAVEVASGESAGDDALISLSLLLLLLLSLDANVIGSLPVRQMLFEACSSSSLSLVLVL
jgi:hypothetical protein